MSRRDVDTIKDPVWKQLINNLRANVIYYREKKKWTQADLAEKSKLNVATIADIEQGKAINPRIESIAALTTAFKLADPLSLLKRPTFKLDH